MTLDKSLTLSEEDFPSHAVHETIICAFIEVLSLKMVIVRSPKRGNWPPRNGSIPNKKPWVGGAPGRTRDRHVY